MAAPALIPAATIAASNTFAVRDPDALRAALSALNIEVLDAAHAPGRVRLVLPDGWSCQRHGVVERASVDLPALIGAHLADGQVVVLKETGTSGRYLAGSAIAFNAHGATVSVDLDEIFGDARALGPRIADDV
jgi:hypothetical protein